MRKGRILLFGQLKTFCPHEMLEVDFEPSMTPEELRKRVSEKIKEKNSFFLGLCELQSSAIANETRILLENEPIGESREFSFLPPVCGG